jgi:probable HAF family extracellular repeat protein
MKQRILIAFVLLLVPIAGAQVYTITDLGPLSPTAINTWGQVVGNLNGKAFIWTQSSGRKGLGTLTGGTHSYASGINDLGVVTGTADGAGTVISEGVPQFPDSSPPPNQECSDLTQPFVWTPRNGMKGLGAAEVPDVDQAPFDWCEIPFFGSGINDLGQVVGYTTVYSTDQYALLWASAGGMTFLSGDLGEGNWPPTMANGVSNTGQLVGQSDNSPYSGHATSWKNGVSTDLATLDGGASSANGVNDLGQIVGWSTATLLSEDGCWAFGSVDITECPMNAVLWNANGKITNLGTLPGDAFSSASNINLPGQVIGSSGNTVVFQWTEGEPVVGESPIAVIGRPFIWTQGSGMRDLNTLISASSGWVLNSATGINLWGQIVGSGTVNGHAHGFLLIPTFFANQGGRP